MRSALITTVLIACSNAGARADRMADFTPLVRAVTSDVAVIGKVTSIEKDTVAAPAYPSVKEKTAYTIAVVKVETNIRGAKGVTHYKVGFYPGSSGTGGHYKFPILEDGQEVCLFLVKYHDANFYVFPPLAPPLVIDAKTKPTADRLRRAAVVFDDPAKALKAEKLEDRVEAACLLVLQYRTQPFGRPSATADVTLDESQAILKILAEADWSKADPELNPARAFTGLGLTAHPEFARVQPKPGEDLKRLWQTELKRWLPTDGKDYKIQKFVPKAK